MEYSISSDVLTVRLSGRIDSSNAAAVEEELVSIRQSNPAGSLILDAEELEYISSAGLRVILRTRKTSPSMKVTNASPEVYDILEMTGFTEMLPVEKAYRRLSVEGCEVIGKGANGKVYRLDPETIIKVYSSPDCLPDIQRERELARRAFVLGIPTAIPYDVVRVGDTYGSVFELLNAQPFSALIAAEPENFEKYVGLYVDLMKKIHATELKPGEIPDMKAVALSWADFLADHLPREQFVKLRSLIEAVPESLHMLHGDYHLKNVMMQNGEVLLIDMDTLCTGNPVFEFASVYLAYVGFGELNHEHTLDFMGVPYETTLRIWDRTLRDYFETEDDAFINAAADKAMVIGYTRLLRRTIRRNGYDTAEGRQIIESCKAHLADLLERVTELAY